MDQGTEHVYLSVIWGSVVVILMLIIVGGAFLRFIKSDQVLLAEGYQQEQLAQACTPVIGWQKVHRDDHGR